MVKEYFVTDIRYNKDDECIEDVFVAKKEKDYTFLTTSEFKTSRRQKLHWTWLKLWLGASQWVVDCKS